MSNPKPVKDAGYPFDTGDWARWTNVKRLVPIEHSAFCIVHSAFSTVAVFAKWFDDFRANREKLLRWDKAIGDHD